jgi:hypothetical protein
MGWKKKKSTFRSRCSFFGAHNQRAFVSADALFFFQPIGWRPAPNSDSSRIIAGAASRPALSPQFFPIPYPGHHRIWQRESELMREHAYLPAMVGFMRNHVAEHFRANRPRLRPAVPAKLRDAGPAAVERFGDHLRAASSALGQSRKGLLRRAVRAVKLGLES